MENNFPQIENLGVYLDWMTVGLQPRISIKRMEELMKMGVGGMYKTGNHLDTKSQDIYWEAIETMGNILKIDYERIVPIAGRETALNALACALPNQEVNLWCWDDNAVHAAFLSRYGKKVKIHEKLDGEINIASTISPLTGARSGIEESDGLKIVDISFEKGIYELNDLDIENSIFIADGSMGLLGPLGSGFMVIGEGAEKYLEKFPIGSLGVSAVNKFEVIGIKNVDRYHVDQVNIIALQGLSTSMQFVKEIPKARFNYLGIKSKVRSILRNFTEIREVSVESSDHISFAVKGWNAQELAIILSEISRVQVRGGQLCSHVAIDKMGVDNVIRVSFSPWTNDKDLAEFKSAIEEILH